MTYTRTVVSKQRVCVSVCACGDHIKVAARSRSSQSSSVRRRAPAYQAQSSPVQSSHRHAAQERTRLLPSRVASPLRGRPGQAQEGEAEEVRISEHEGHPVLQLPVVRPPRLLGPRPPGLRQHHGAEHRLLHPRHGVPVHRDHLRVRQAGGDRAGDRAGARAHVRARQGLLQEERLVRHVLQAQQGAVRLRDLQPHRRLATALHALQEAPLHGRGALLAAPPRLTTPHHASSTLQLPSYRSHRS